MISLLPAANKMPIQIKIICCNQLITTYRHCWNDLILDAIHNDKAAALIKDLLMIRGSTKGMVAHDESEEKKGDTTV